MLSRSTSRSLCRSCLYEPQSALENRFYQTANLLKARTLRLQQCNASKVTHVSFSTTSRQFAAEDRTESRGQTSSSHRDLIGEEDTFASQAAIVELLEKELGKCLEQGTKKDQIPIQEAAEYAVEDDALDLSVDLETLSTNPIDRVRDAGASPADVARAARQIYGDTLPEESLSNDELSIYRRLYGEPARVEEKVPEEMDPSPRHELYTSQGEQIDYTSNHELQRSSELADLDLTRARAMGVAQSLQGSVVEEDDFEDDYEDADEDSDASDSDRGHPLTKVGRFKTDPKTVFLPQEALIQPVNRIMSGFSNKHLKETSERLFGGPGLPDSALTPRSGRSRKQVPIPLDVIQNSMGEMEANAYITTIMPPTYASVLSVLTETRKRLGATWLTRLLAKEGGPRILDAGAGGAGIIAWREIVRAHWDSLHMSDKGSPTPPSSKSVVLTSSDALRHRAAALLENTTFVPRLPDYVHTRATPTMEDDRPAQRRKQFDVIIAPHVLFGLKEDWMRKQYVQNLWSLLNENGGVLVLIEKGVPRGFEAIAEVREMLLDRYIAVPEGHKTHYSRGDDQLLNDDGIHKRTKGMIVAPCTNHERCPMYATPGLSRGRRDICSFQQRYIRPPFLQRVLGAQDRNHDDVDFSYISVLKGDDLRLREIDTWDHLVDPISAPVSEPPAEQSQVDRSLVDETKVGFEDVTPDNVAHLSGSDPDGHDMVSLPGLHQLPRIVYPPLKRRGHVTMDLCTPTGQIERWTIPRSFSRQAYRDARKSKWGDLWALGAKTHVKRNLQLGTPQKDLFGKDGEIIQGKGRGRKERLRIKAQEMLERREQQEADDLLEQRDLIAGLDEELDADAGVPRDNLSSNSEQPGTKPMNNRERKQARKAQRAAEQLMRETRQTREDAFDDSETTHELAEWRADWQAEYDMLANVGKGKKGGAYNKFGSSSRTAKSLQKSKDKTGEFVRR